jgi:hypothetical protein
MSLLPKLAMHVRTRVRPRSDECHPFVIGKCQMVAAIWPKPQAQIRKSGQLAVPFICAATGAMDMGFLVAIPRSDTKRIDASNAAPALPNRTLA